MHFVLYFYALTSCVYALSVRPRFKNDRLKARSNPSIGVGNKNVPTLHDGSLHNAIVKRTDPAFYDGDYGKTTEGEDRRKLLEGAFPDVYTLVVTTLNHWDDVIFDHWFPARDKQKVMNVLGSIIKSQVNIVFPLQSIAVSNDSL